jgi:hypothetical protein
MKPFLNQNHLRKAFREILFYRSWITAALIGLTVWLLLTNSHKGTEIWIANRPLNPGESIQASDFSRGWIEAPDDSAYTTNLKEVLAMSVVAAIPSGTPLLKRQLGEAIDVNRVIVNLPLETGDNANYPEGAQAHIWGIQDGFVQLISAEAIVLGTSAANLGSPRVSLSIPATAEAQAIQANSVRIVLLSTY